MGVLDEAIREHLDLKRRRGASDDEIARAEAEALGPARRPVPEAGVEEGERGPGGDETLIVPPVEDVAPPPALRSDQYDEPTRIDRAAARPEPTRAVHDIDEDPLAPPAPVAGIEPEDIDDDPGPLSRRFTGEDVDDEPATRPRVDDEPPVDEPPIDQPPHEDPGSQRRF